MIDFMYYLQSVRATVTNSKRYTDPRTNETYISHREIWTRAPRAAARKATAEGVTGIVLDETGGRFYIFQVSGYTRERGLYCDMLNESGQVVTA